MTVSTSTELVQEAPADDAFNTEPPKSSKRWIWVALGVALLAGGGLWYQQSHRAPTITYTTTPVDRGAISSKVTATGTLSALVTVQVGSQVSGRVAKLYADFNSPVHKGEILARIDPKLFQAALEQAQANYEAAVAGVLKARVQALDAQRQADRQVMLAKQNFVAFQDRDTAVANAAVARAQITTAASEVQQAQAALDQAKTNLAYTSIGSPINGTVISRSVDVGQTVAASLSAPTIFVLAQDLRKLQVDTSVAEADVGRLKSGMPSFFTVDAYPNERFRGKVRQIRNSATSVQNVVTYDAVIDVANPKLELKPGMTANVTFIDARKTDALRIPNAALRFQPTEVAAPVRAGKPAATGAARGHGGGGHGGGGRAGGGNQAPSNIHTVWVLVAGKPEAREIHTGISDGSLTEVASGALKAGDVVITDEQGAPAHAATPAGGGRGLATRGMGF